MNRRKQIDQEIFDLAYLHKIMLSIFPRKNDCGSLAELEEVVGELNNFLILTKLQVRLFLKKHRRRLLEIDKEPLDAYHQELYREDLGDKMYLDIIRRQYWFCYPAFIRIALEIEFGKDNEFFANEADGI